MDTIGQYDVTPGYWLELQYYVDIEGIKYHTLPECSTIYSETEKMMIKILFLGMMAACAMAQFPLMGMGGFGGFDLKNIKNMIPEGTFDMIKNMKPEDIKNAVANMPPQMAEMMKGMGISEDQIKEAVANMPEDFDVASIIDQAQDNMGGLVDNAKDEMKEQMAEEMSGFKEEGKKYLEELGLDVSGGAEGLMSQILPKLTGMLGEQLRAEGIDTDDREKIHEAIRKQIREFAGADENDTEEEVKEKMMRNFLEEMRQNGYEIKSDDTEEGFEEVKKHILGHLKDFGFDLEDDLDIKNLPEIIKNAMKSEKFNPQMIMKMVAPMMQGVAPMMQAPQMGPMRPPMMHAPPMGMHPGMNLNLDINIHDRPSEVPIVTPGYVRGAEDALLHAFGDDSEVTRHVMAVKFGAETGTVMEEDLNELLKDLMHYRLEARVLMAKNNMLRSRLYDRMML